MKIALRIITPFVIIAAAVFGFIFLKGTAPEPKSRVPKPVIPEVSVVSLSPADHNPPVLSYGTVSSYFETQLTPEISGRIIEVAPEFRLGNTVKEDAILIRIDPTDFEAALAREKSLLTVAQRTLAEEEIRAQQAASDWKASGRDLSKASPFVLRKPQLAAAQANIDSARASIEKALADLERTNIRAPFDAVVTARSASVGNLAFPQGPQGEQGAIGTLVSINRAELLLPLTAKQAARVKLPTTAILTSPTRPGVEWRATIARTTPTVDRNQTVTLIAEIEKPFTAAAQPLAIGTFVNAAITAEAISASYEVPEIALINDEFIWALDEKNRLVQIKTTRIQSQNRKAYLILSSEKLTPPLRIVARPLANFEAGLEISPLAP